VIAAKLSAQSGSGINMTLQQAVVLALQVSILMTVFGFGLRTTVSDVMDLVRRPSLIGRSLVAMFVIMPIVAVALAQAFELRPSVKIALVALAISPIPPLLPGREQKAGGHASYALGLMMIAAVLSIAIVPAEVDMVGRYFMRPFAVSPWAIAGIALKAAVLPLLAGMLLRAVLPGVAARITKPVEIIATVLLVAGVLALLAGTFRAVLSLVGNGSIVAMAAFVVIGLAVGHALGGPSAEHRLVLALSTASRHPAIALAIAKANFPDEPHLGATIILYLLVSLLIGIPYQIWQERRMR
jgi:bile acid:Na+ symporter, BASS family